VDLLEELRALGFELHDGEYDHDTIWGHVRRPVDTTSGFVNGL
jgi:hypothetical protein